MFIDKKDINWKRLHRKTDVGSRWFLYTPKTLFAGDGWYNKTIRLNFSHLFVKFVEKVEYCCFGKQIGF